MAATFSEGKTGLDEISLAIRNAKTLIAQARQNPTTVVQSLDALSAQYQSLLADIDSAAAANPTNTALKVLKEEKNLLVAEFTAKRAEAVALQTKIAGT